MTGRIDRYVRGELTAEEGRELAQASLDSAELFEELTSLALAKRAFSQPGPAGKIVRFPGVRFPRGARFLIAGAAAAAALVWLSLANLRPLPSRSTHLKPALAFSANPGQPVLLASGLHPESTPVFRSAEPDSRAPRPAGTIVSMEDGLANIDLGSLDGVAQGGELQVFRQQQSAEVIGHLRVIAVFRERARGRVVSGEFAGERIHTKDQVRVAGGAYLGALLDQVDARFNRGDPDAAGKMAEQAASWAETGSVSPGEQSAAWNKLGVLYMLRGDTGGAETPLSRAVSASRYGPGLNNLGVLSELRGDRRKAESLYAEALRVSAGAERRAVESNLARVTQVRGSR